MGLCCCLGSRPGNRSFASLRRPRPLSARRDYVGKSARLSVPRVRVLPWSASLRPRQVCARALEQSAENTVCPRCCPLGVRLRHTSPPSNRRAHIMAHLPQIPLVVSPPRQRPWQRLYLTPTHSSAAHARAPSHAFEYVLDHAGAEQQKARDSLEWRLGSLYDHEKDLFKEERAVLRRKWSVTIICNYRYYHTYEMRERDGEREGERERKRRRPRGGGRRGRGAPLLQGKGKAIGSSH